MTGLDEVLHRIEDLKDNNGVPSNVKEMLEESIQALEDEDEEISVRVNTATSLLDQISNDPNIAQHTRTEVWNIASKLESVQE